MTVGCGLVTKRQDFHAKFSSSFAQRRKAEPEPLAVYSSIPLGRQYPFWTILLTFNVQQSDLHHLKAAFVDT